MLPIQPNGGQFRPHLYRPQETPLSKLETLKNLADNSPDFKITEDIEDELSETLITDPDFEKKQIVVDIFVKKKCTSGVESMVMGLALFSNDNEDFCFKTIDAICKIGGDTAIDQLGLFLYMDPENEINIKVKQHAEKKFDELIKARYNYLPLRLGFPLEVYREVKLALRAFHGQHNRKF